MSPFVCHACEEIIRSPYDQFERRIEFRALRNQARYRVLLTGRLCRQCVDTEVDKHRPPPAWRDEPLFRDEPLL